MRRSLSSGFILLIILCFTIGFLCLDQVQDIDEQFVCLGCGQILMEGHNDIDHSPGHIAEFDEPLDLNVSNLHPVTSQNLLSIETQEELIRQIVLNLMKYQDNCLNNRLSEYNSETDMVMGINFIPTHIGKDLNQVYFSSIKSA